MTKPPLLWINLSLFALTLAITLTLVPWRLMSHGFDITECLSFLVLVFFSGLSITAGYHRLWSHKSYKAHTLIRCFFALGGALALQNSVLHWASDHRMHHKHVDSNDKDPYSAKRGFWFSHIGWMLREYQPQSYYDYANVRDLQQDPVVIWQHRHYLALTLLMNLGLPAMLGWLNGDLLSMLLLAGFARLVLVHHCTFLINSLAHRWGTQPYTDTNTARDNPLLALLTYGEGYHNFHHIFEHDYRNGIHWWDYDPTKWLIKALAWCGLATGLKQVSPERIESTRLKMQLTRSQRRIAGRLDHDEMTARLQREYEALKQRLLEYYQAKKELLDARRSKLSVSELMPRVCELRSRLRSQKQHWNNLTAACRQG